MAYDPSTDLEQVQSDILTQDTSTNTLMPSSPLDFLNKALKTDQTNIVGALNDIQTLVNGLIDNFVNFGNKYNNIIMDTDSSVGQAKVTEMKSLLGYSTLLEAIVELAKKNNGTSSSGFISNFSLDGSTNILSLTLSDGTVYPIDLTPLLNTKANETDLEWGSF